ncbi:hypothetical protein Sjap_010602 [Stephania japonica]|uniref:Uncharacterized protein n=1 Tax=Stephania japonica TaxID=461633 RepID=A0AAP0JAS1_9MAGN
MVSLLSFDLLSFSTNAITPLPPQSHHPLILLVQSQTKHLCLESNQTNNPKIKSKITQKTTDLSIDSPKTCKGLSNPAAAFPP